MNTTPARRPWRKRLVIIVVVVALLIAAAEVALRLILPGVIASAVRQEVGLTEDQPVDVDLGGLAVAHAVTGRVGDIDLHIDEMPIMGAVSGQIDVHADSLPMRPTSGDLRGGIAKITLDEEQLDPAIELITGGFASTGEVRGDEILVGGAVPMFGQEVAVSVALAVDIADGDVVVTPGTLNAAGFELSSEQIADFAGGILDPMLGSHTICVRDQLPQGITLTDVTVSSTGTVAIEADLAPGILSDPAQQEPGTCPADE